MSDGEVGIHDFFGLSYSNYLVLNRTLLQSMPWEWQVRFVAMIAELDLTMADVPRASTFRVNALDSMNRFIKDPVPHYDRGRAHVGPVDRARTTEPTPMPNHAYGENRVPIFEGTGCCGFPHEGKACIRPEDSIVHHSA